ncbi:YycH family regulatory protein [Liquorilactobacillus oeni]|uniref:YycH family protein n=1 Tax=Liquorilactobacillus oeni DSM 19972 TaxID=1423777 RepID=A0A0R1MCU8_9LACO|nr:two-component system activity regulator YycH [Liquorilactobacillus oeni]KRL05830.1 YycH family protein [Liquorilactobacillus oeni DSM 19972]
MKASRVFLHFGLVITILISIFLSILIWINPATFQHDSKATTNTGENSENVNKKKMSDVFLPLQATLNQNDQEYFLFSHKFDVTSKVSQQLRKIKVKDGSLKTYKTDSEYQNFLRQNNALLLNYNNPITTKLFNQVFSQKLKGLQDYKFNRILIPLQNEKNIFLVSDQTKQAYEVTTKKNPYSKIKGVLASANIKKLGIAYYPLSNEELTVFYTNSFSLPRYSYLINKSNISPFLNQLLNSKGQSSISTKLQKEKTIYSDSTNNRIEVNDRNGQVTYENYSNLEYYDENQRIQTQKQSLYDHLKESFTQLKSLGVQLDDVRYAEYNESDNSVTYRSYIAGFPIINEDSYGTYKIQLMNSGGKKYVFSLNNLQVPVPSGGAREELPSTYTVYQKLQSAGYPSSEIKNIKVAYKWEQSTSSKLVVDLVPTYFIYYSGHWQSYQDLLAHKVISGN